MMHTMMHTIMHAGVQVYHDDTYSIMYLMVYILPLPWISGIDTLAHHDDAVRMP